MWMGELITDRGIGNGMSVMIFTQVIAVIPGELLTIFQTKKAFTGILSVLVVFVVIAFVVFMEQAQRRIPVQYAKRMVGRRMYGGTSTYIPMKVNQGRRHPRHLRLQPAVYPAARDLAVRQPDAPARAGSRGSSATWKSATTAATCRPCGCTWPRSSC